MPEVAVGLMAKFPELGKVKTRLAADIGPAGALRVYTLLLQQASETIRRLDRGRYHTSVFVAKRDLVEKFKLQYPGANHYAAQVSGNLGKRMESALKKLLSQDHIDRAILIGADIPDLSSELIEDAATALEKKDVVLGPTLDGGYYLIGMKEVTSELFRDIEWSSDTVLAESKKRLKKLGLKTHLLEKLADLDTLADANEISPRNQLIIDTLGTYLEQGTSINKENENG